MDAAYVSALAALAGSAIGALASLATSWLSQASQVRATQRAQDRTRREALYGDFIREASRLFVDAFEHELDDPAKLVNLYAIVSLLRLFGQPRTLHEAERVMNRIGAAYFEPNKELRLFADITHAGELDPLCAFSQACRDELLGPRPVESRGPGSPVAPTHEGSAPCPDTAPPLTPPRRPGPSRRRG